MKITSLHEGISPIVYHFTSIYGAGKIASENRFRLTAAYANPSEREMGVDKLFFLSTTRSANGGYTRRGAYTRNVVLKLDGRKLAQNYKGRPVQYFSRNYIKMDQNFDETEDRVFSDSPIIPDAASYILEAHVLVVGEVLEARDRSVIKAMKLRQIPFFLYQDINAFLLQDTRKAVPLSSYRMTPAENPPNYSRYDSRASDKQQIRRSGSDKLTYGPGRWLELMTRPVDQFDSMHYSKKDFIRDIVRGYDRDALNSLDGDLHNTKSKLEWTSRLAPLLKKNNLRSTRDVMDFIAARWKPVAAS